jgi:dolichyl-phosphate-mannose-protein mannosyltransferase
MSGQQGSVRKRKDASVVGKAKEPAVTGIATPQDTDLDALVKANSEIQSPGVEWDYRIAITIITILAFITRFWGISHPNEVVFDEVHFGKVITFEPSPYQFMALC